FMCFDLMAVGVNIICFLYVFDALIMKRHKKTGINAGNVGNDKINDKRLITESF
ncbi:hypothetical protein CT555_004431, partial [Salmonella enterica subsp. enterica serovar Anatum]|nr:hypothetical protein [Salmonella enterica]EDQ7855108.1 hypothetical protein [Salmonella enterica subsp. enterica serovar Anatum]EDR0134526.1 hypothetical protein [Salmonella enterica subsp. enterica]EDT3406088.1 hypothetical protein [Salmonella enterica subsp. enterica serovar Anatum]EDU8083974.1 hypothetical protein [Salmonella enterica subsp. enterica serovar Anatum]